MAAFNFPNSPSTNDLHTENGVTFKWNGTIWLRVANSYSDVSTLNVSGIGTFGGHVYISEYIIHSGDTNTWFRFPSNDNITFGTAGSERVRITSDGNVGINDSSPSFKLDVNGTGRFTDDLTINTTKKIKTNSSQGQLTIQPGPSYPGGSIKFAGGQSGATDRGTLIFYAGETTSLQERLRIDSSGNLMVGATSGSWAIQALRTSGTTTIASKNTGGNASVYIEASNGNTAKLELAEAGTGSYSLQVGDDNALMIFDDSTERHRINQWGGVGIRTDKTTSYGVSIAGASAAMGAGNLTDSGGLILQPTDAFFASNRTYPCILWSGNTNSLARARAGITAVSANSNDASHISFMTRHAANGTALTTDDERMRIADDGVVQVGKDNQSSTTYTQQMYIRGRYVNAEGDFAKLLFRNSTDSGSCSAGIRGRRDAASNYATGLTFHTNQGNNNTTDSGQGRKTMHISSEGWVTMPYQSCFQAHTNGASSVDIPSNTGNDLVFPSESFDNHNDYNTSNGRFTAPVAGKYVFGIQIYAGFSITGVRVLHARFRKNGGDIYETDLFGGTSNAGGTSYHPTAAGTVMYDLAANDYVTWNIGSFAGSGSGHATIYGAKGTRFWGYLVA